MKLLPIIVKKQANYQSEIEYPSFKQKNINKLLSNSIAHEISNNPNLKDIWGDTGKRNIFMATLGSLVVAAAAEITRLVSGGETSDTVIKTSDDGDTVEIKKDNLQDAKSVKFVKHKGKQADYELALISAINEGKVRAVISEDDEKQLADLYNKFCGLNYKDFHYNSEQEKISNKDIVNNLIQELNNCKTKDELSLIISKYNQYTVQQEETVKQVPEKEEEVIPENIDGETVEYIKNYKKILNNYFKTCRDANTENEKEMVEAFIKDVYAIQKEQNIKNIYMQKINSNYSDYLTMLAAIFNDLKQNQEEANLFLSGLANKVVDFRAIQGWKAIKHTYNLTFMEYNDMIKNGYDEDSIKAFAKHKRNANLKFITINNPNSFTVGLTTTNIQKSFNIINNLFNVEHSGNYQSLIQNDDENFTIDDIENEIRKKSDSYPNLMQYLTVNKNDKFYLNQGKMQNLVDIYNQNEHNKFLFTLHSYLRFIERVILNGITPDDIITCGDVRSMFIKNIQELKNALKEFSKNPVTVNTYCIDDVKAPQFQIEFPLKSKNYLTITINKDNKIHTLY